MMAIPVYLPADPGIGEAEIPAVDRVARFESERRYLLRETRAGDGWFSPAVHAFFLAMCAAWILAFSVALRPASNVARRPKDSIDPPPVLASTSH